MKWIFFFAFSIYWGVWAQKPSSSPFRTYVVNQPSTLNPAHLYGTESSYIFHNLFRGLYRFDDEKGVLPEGAKNCIPSHKKLTCSLNSDVKWSDGTPVLAQDYVRAFRYLVDPQNKSRNSPLLLKIKNAQKILKGQSAPSTLGVLAPSDFQLIFNFEESDPEFIEKLTAHTLVPWKTLPDLSHPQSVVTNGPYTLKKYIKDQKIYLEPNATYPFGNPQRPPVEFLFLEEESTAQNLFDTGILDLHHRMDVSLIPKFKNHPGFYQKTFSRFDYIGFGPELLKNKDLRVALAHALDYEELAKLLHAKGRPGCTGLEESFSKSICYNFDLKKAKKAFEKVPQELKEKLYVIKFSRASGENMARIMEWYQHQLKKHLGLKVHIETLEQGLYLRSIYESPPDLFRKGINLDRPSCTSALEGFHSKSPDNYIHLKSSQIDQWIQELEKESSKSAKKNKCNKMIQYLMDEYVFIPQGLIHYSMLTNPRFKGWKFNGLNQLDLSGLTLEESKAK